MSQMSLHVTSLAKNNMANGTFCHTEMSRHMVVSRVAVFEGFPAYFTGKAELWGIIGLWPGPLAFLRLTSTYTSG